MGSVVPPAAMVKSKLCKTGAVESAVNPAKASASALLDGVAKAALPGNATSFTAPVVDVKRKNVVAALRASPIFTLMLFRSVFVNPTVNVRDGVNGFGAPPVNTTLCGLASAAVN